MLTIHPKRGFLNTEFTVCETDSYNIEFKISLLKPFNEKNISTLDKIPTLFEIGKDKPMKLKFDKAGVYKLEYSADDENHTQEFIVEDAVKLGGSSFKHSFVFEGTPWCFVVMRDRTYFFNRETEEQYVEAVSPDKIEYVNRGYVILSNNGESDNSIYSLLQRQSVLNFEKYAFKNEHIVIIDRTGSDDDSYSYLEIIVLNGPGPENLKIDYDKYFIDKDNGFLYILFHDEVLQYSLDTLDQIQTLKPDGNVVCFIAGGYAIIRKGEDVPRQLQVYSLNNQTIAFTIRQPKPILGVLGNDFIDPDDDKAKIYARFTENKDISEYIDIKMTFTYISDIFCTKGYLYYRVSQTIYSMNNYGKVKYEYIDTLWNGSNENIATLGSDYTVYRYGERFFIKSGQLNYCIEGNLLDTLPSEYVLHPSVYGCVICRKYGDGKEGLYHEGNGCFTESKPSKYDWSEFKKHGIIKDLLSCDLIYLSNNSLNVKKYRQGTSLFHDNRGNLKYGNDILVHGDIRLIDKDITTPDKWDSVSEDCNYMIGISGAHIYLYSNTGDSRISYIQHEILTEIFDSSSYGRVLLSDDGENILYQDNKGNLVLLNPLTGASDNFENTHFITHVNGNRPIFKIDNSHRRARLFDPISNAEINQDYITNYTFVSPDNRFYASTKVSDYTRFFNKITK